MSDNNSKALLSTTILITTLSTNNTHKVHQEILKGFHDVLHDVIIYGDGPSTDNDRSITAIIAKAILNALPAMVYSSSKDGVSYGHDWAEVAKIIPTNNPSVIKTEPHCFNCHCDVSIAPSFCPGRPLSSWVKDLLADGTLDYIMGYWVNLSTKEVGRDLCLMNTVAPKGR